MQSTGPILIVDDEDDLRNLLRIHLEREGFTTAAAASGAEALELAQRFPPALVVLDLMLPDLGGTEVCRRLRASPELSEVPIIMLTARGEEIDRVVGFEVGADDYIVKSAFSMREFVLRVRAVLRRRQGAPDQAPSTTPAEPAAEPLAYGVLSIDPGGHRVLVQDSEVVLTPIEFKLLHALASHPGRVQSRGLLLQQVWGMPPELNTRTVDTHVKRLREKLGPASAHLETVRGVGYRFNATPH